MSETPTAVVLAPLRYRRLRGKVLVTGRTGAFAILSEGDFGKVRDGSFATDDALVARLRAAQLLGGDDFDLKASVLALGRRTTFLGYGPNLHVLVLTRRCNETCAYCHASRDTESTEGRDMTEEIATRSVDLALASTSPAVTLEFQGGEPLLRFDLIQRIVEHALEKNADLGKQVEFTLVSNLALMDEDKLAWLVDHRVQICTSIDGPADLHDKQRKLVSLSAHGEASRWIRRINERYAELGLDPIVYRVEALLTTTRPTLARWKEVVDTYVGLGCRALFLRPLDPFGFAAQTRAQLGYSTEEFLDFYRQAVDYMIALNLDGVQVLERFAAIFLTKILTGDDPNYLDIRSPCGAGIGQVAYNYDGGIFTCDEGRMLHGEGDDTFLLGNVGQARYRDLMGHETVRAIAVASNLDAQPACDQCAYRPYCGVCPVYNHKTQGSLFGRMLENDLCRLHMGIQDYLFDKIAQDDPAVLEVLRRWTTNRPRDHYLHAPGHAPLHAGSSGAHR